MEYERRRNKRVQYFESVRTAQTVQIEDIPLPDMSEKPVAILAAQPQLPFGSVPMPPNFPPQIPPKTVPIPPSIQNAIAAHQKAVAEEKAASEPKKKEPPGCPPGPPPDLLAMRDLDSDYESDDSERGRRSPVSKRYKSSRRYSSDQSSNRSDDRDSESDNEIDVPKPTSVQQRMLAIAGQKYDDFMKELENVHSQSEDRQSSKQNERKRNDDGSGSDDETHRKRNELKQNASDSSKVNAPIMKQGDQTNDAQSIRRDNPAAIPNMSAVPAPPIPPPMLHKIPRPPPPPMGELNQVEAKMNRES